MPAPLSILHIDDEPIILDMVREILKDTVRVDRAESLAAAREMIIINGYDLLLVDLKLGDSDGVETIEALRPYGIPMVVLSALDAPEVLAAAAAAGADDYILKTSLGSMKLLNRLQFAHARHLRREAYARQEEARREAQRKRYFDEGTFEAIKPFISCANVAMSSRRVFAGR